jgi:serine/threonine-protein kinase
LTGQLSSDEQITRFEREAKLAGRLQHPNIVAVHEVGRHEGMPYFSMDFVDGHSLNELVRDNPLPPREAEGDTNQEIAEKLGVVPRTVERKVMSATSSSPFSIHDQKSRRGHGCS